MQRRLLLKNIGLLSGGLLLQNQLKAQTNSSKKFTRIAHITDIHVQPVIGAAKGLERCLHHIQGLSRVPDLIMNGGDAIMGSHGAKAHSIDKQWELYKSVLQNENHLPIFSCVGNHDIYRKKEGLMGFEDGKKVAKDHLQMHKAYYAFEKANWKVIVLDSVMGKENGYIGKLDEEQMHWLKKQLKETDASQYIMIVSHIPILSACVFFDGKNFKDGAWRVPESWMHADSEELVELFHQYPQVKLALSGHIHLADKIEYNGLTYCCNGAVSGNWWMGSYKQTHPGYAIIDLYEDGSFTNDYVRYS